MSPACCMFLQQCAEMRQQAGMLTLLLLLAACARPTPARLIVNTTSASAPFAEIAALFNLPQEQLSMGIPDSDFLAVLATALDATDKMVQEKVDMRNSLFAFALNMTSKALEGPKDFVLQAAGLNNTWKLQLPAALPNLTSAFPNFNITNFPTMPWLNNSITIKGFPKYDFLNWTMSLLTPQIPILNSKLILSNNFTQATLQLMNSTKKT